MRLLFCLFFGITATVSSIAQPRIVKRSGAVDSLQQLLQEAESDSVKVILMTQLALEQSLKRMDDGIETSEKALRKAQRLTSNYLTGVALHTIGKIYFHYDLMDKAKPIFDRFVSFADSVADARLSALAWYDLGNYFERQNDLKVAIEAYLKAVPSFEKTENFAQLGEVLRRIGTAYLNLQNTKKAFQYQRDALAVFESQKLKVGVLQTLIQLGRIYLVQGDFAEAQTHFDDALDRSKALKNETVIVESLLSIGDCKFEQKDYDRAKKYYLEAADWSENTTDKSLLPRSLQALSEVSLRLNQPKVGIEYERKAVSLYRLNHDQHAVAECLNRMGKAYYSEVGYSQALRLLEEALKINTTLGLNRNVGEGHLHIGYVYIQQSKYNEALVATKKGLAIAENLNDKPLLQQANLQLSLIYAAKKQFKEAYITHQNYAQLSDSLSQENSTRQMDEFNTRFEEEVNALESQNYQRFREQRVWTILLLVLLVALLALAAYLYKTTHTYQMQVKFQEEMLAQRNQAYNELQEMLRKMIEKQEEK